MSINQASAFLAGSLLTMVGFIIVVIGIVVVNNIIHKYWKPLGWFAPWAAIFNAHSEPKRFVETQEIDKAKEPKLK